MIDRDQLRAIHEADLPLHILEQDYVQALFIQELYRNTEDLVFKGGTFLKHAHGLDRFSEDLDFTQTTPTDVADALSATATELDRYGIPASVDNVTHQEHSVLARLRYQGPLFDGTDRSRGSIEIDVSTRADTVREPEWRRLFFPYPETRTATALCQVIEEAFAEKLRALSTRSRARDLYDCWFLLQSDIRIDKGLFEQKMSTVDQPPTVKLTVLERDWDRELGILVEHPPAYDDVKQTVTNAISEAGLQVTGET